MFALNAVTFSALKGTALAVAAVNAVLLAAVLVCLLLAHGLKKQKKQPEQKTRSFFDNAPQPGTLPDKAAISK